MASVVLSKDEKVFIKNGVFDDFRLDGRARRDYRYFEIETGIVSNTNGSARLRLVRKNNYYPKCYHTIKNLSYSFSVSNISRMAA